MPGDRPIVARARAVLGVPFRLHGRDAAYGLDCVGLVAHALGIVPMASGYVLRGDHERAIAADMAAAGLVRVEAPPRAGDVLVLRCGPGLVHLGVWTGASLIHADARLRRIVETPAPLSWPLHAIWRIFGEN